MATRGWYVALMRYAVRYSWLTYLLTVALLLQTLLPFAASYDWARPSAVPAFTALDEKVLICTAQGFQWVKWADLQSGKEQPKPPPHYKCPACYIASHGLGTPTKIVALDASVPLTALRWLPSYTHTALSGDILWRRDRSRAPPVVFA